MDFYGILCIKCEFLEKSPILVKVPPDPHKSQNNQYSVVALEKTVLNVFIIRSIRRVGCQFIAKYSLFFGDHKFFGGGLYLSEH